MLALLFFCIALAAAYPTRGVCSGDCWTKDPSVIQRVSDGKFFRFGTGTGIPIITSDSIKGPWTSVGAVLPSGSEITVTGVDSTDIWAPDVHYADGTYYLYYVLSQIGTQNSEIGVATSTTLESGSWTDHGVVGIPDNSAYNRIDPAWISIDGQEYLNFGSFWEDIFQVPLANPLQVDSTAPYELAYNSSLNHREEGSYMFQNGDYYYLLISGGQAGDYTATTPPQGEEYRISVCRSSSGTGNFVDQDGTACTESGGTLLLSSHGQVYGPGGPGVLQDNDVGLVLYYHYYPLAKKQAGGSNSNADYLFSWNVLGWENGWPYVAS
ncbi:hypothetical protein N7495_004326 [Penicillium taxi]|uniref:uncharacterized protein n=1 Tax=Penicillium taxi TaxID=168475 RepID=UPI002544F101|nr:uncharacterized protein N7495_004326 [Penicillium taxi]KAJ5899582.1 hypothetical protein N7495_004326 [Penicillium taxi]